MRAWAQKQNIARFEKLLREATDPRERSLLQDLLGRERQSLVDELRRGERA